MGLMFFLLCFFVSGVILASAAVNVSRAAAQKEEQQAYLAINAAANLLHGEVDKLQSFTAAETLITHDCHLCDAENGASSLTVTHVKIEAVRGDAPASQTTAKTTTTTGAQVTTTTGAGGSTTRTTLGTGDYTYVDGVPYITFRHYGDEGTLGTWWWNPSKPDALTSTPTAWSSIRRAKRSAIPSSPRCLPN